MAVQNASCRNRAAASPLHNWRSEPAGPADATMAFSPDLPAVVLECANCGSRRRVPEAVLALAAAEAALAAMRQERDEWRRRAAVAEPRLAAVQIALTAGEKCDG